MQRYVFTLELVTETYVRVSTKKLQTSTTIFVGTQQQFTSWCQTSAWIEIRESAQDAVLDRQIAYEAYVMRAPIKDNGSLDQQQAVKIQGIANHTDIAEESEVYEIEEHGTSLVLSPSSGQL